VWILTGIQKILAGYTDVLIAVNPIVRDELIQKGIGSASEFVVIYPGFDACATIPKALARFNLGLNPKGLVIGYIGRFEQIKRPDILAEVVKTISALDVDVQFLICGGGSLYSKFQESTRDDKVRCLGWIKNVTEFYSAIDLLILTSDNEGSPLAIIQGNFNGFLSGDTSFDITEMLQSILLDSYLLQNVSRNVRIDFNLRFNATDFLQKHAAVYSG
jgi:glycosyltransferase involved in cell wall biosynthesis